MMSMPIFYFFEPIFITGIALIGLVVGSFLNVVIYRLPIMIDKAEMLYAKSVLYPDKQVEEQEEAFNLLVPPSACPKCGSAIRAWQNIPVISFLIQGGRCRGCRTKISWRYPLVELLTAALSAVVAIRFGADSLWQLSLALLFTWSLIALVFIDADTQLLPDNITLPLMWLGIIAGIFHVFVPLETAVLGAIIGYLSLWSVYWVFKLWTGKEGMGYGDFKLLAALCAFQGPMALALILLIAPVLGLCFALLGRFRFGHAMAFGPFLAIAGWLSFLFGHELLPLFGWQVL